MVITKRAEAAAIQKTGSRGYDSIDSGSSGFIENGDPGRGEARNDNIEGRSKGCTIREGGEGRGTATIQKRESKGAEQRGAVEW